MYWNKNTKNFIILVLIFKSKFFIW